jgi:hypothetical protein
MAYFKNYGMRLFHLGKCWAEYGDMPFYQGIKGYHGLFQNLTCVPPPLIHITSWSVETKAKWVDDHISHLGTNILKVP